MHRFFLCSFMMLASTSLFAGEFDLQAILGERFISSASWRGELTPDYAALIESHDLELEEAKELVTLHHSVTGSKESVGGLLPKDLERQAVSSIAETHITTYKWADIGLHYVISQSGSVFEGRPLKAVGAHTGGLNRKNAGIAFLGCYDDQGCAAEGYPVSIVTDEMVDSAAAVVAFLAKTYDFAITKESVMPRSSLELARRGSTNFPYSPGNRIIERLDEILERAQAVLETL